MHAEFAERGCQAEQSVEKQFHGIADVDEFRAEYVLKRIVVCCSPRKSQHVLQRKLLMQSEYTDSALILSQFRVF
jgi:hypothetical protein